MKNVEVFTLSHGQIVEAMANRKKAEENVTPIDHIKKYHEKGFQDSPAVAQRFNNISVLYSIEEQPGGACHHFSMMDSSYNPGRPPHPDVALLICQLFCDVKSLDEMIHCQESNVHGYTTIEIYFRHGNDWPGYNPLSKFAPDIPASECPKCMNSIKRAVAINTVCEGPAVADRFTMCNHCGAILRFNEDLSLRVTTDSDMHELTQQQIDYLNMAKKEASLNINKSKTNERT